jgi:hypothetical protein
LKPIASNKTIGINIGESIASTPEIIKTPNSPIKDKAKTDKGLLESLLMALPM